jgi:hypothetical protein
LAPSRPARLLRPEGYDFHFYLRSASRRFVPVEGTSVTPQWVAWAWIAEEQLCGLFRPPHLSVVAWSCQAKSSLCLHRVSAPAQIERPLGPPTHPLGRESRGILWFAVEVRAASSRAQGPLRGASGKAVSQVRSATRDAFRTARNPRLRGQVQMPPSLEGWQSTCTDCGNEVSTTQLSSSPVDR